jgi:hypothetical protein
LFCLAAGVVGWRAPAAAASVPSPFEPLRIGQGSGFVDVELWGRTYHFESGPLPEAIRSQGKWLFLDRPHLEVTVARITRDIVWQPPTVLAVADDVVRLHSVGTLDGLRISADTQIEYDGMIAVDLTLTALQPIAVERLVYQLELSPVVASLFSRHLSYSSAIENVDKTQLLASAGTLPSRLALDFVPSLALGNRNVGIEWWSETNVHWNPSAGVPAFEVVKGNGAVHFRVTPIAAPLALGAGASWRDKFTLFVFPTRPAPERWRSVRFLPSTRVWSLDPNVGSRFMFMAAQSAFHALYDGLPGSIDDAFQRSVRNDLRQRGVGYMPYGMLFVAPLLNPRTMTSFEEWAASRWWRLQPDWENATLERNAPNLAVGDPYTYPPCAARQDYFDWMLEENLRALRAERLDGFYFDQGAITRMCIRNPILEGKAGRQTWEYRNVRNFYKRLYEAVKAEAPDTLIMIHTNGTPKALGAFVDFHVSGEALNGFFGGGRPATEYFSNPDVYSPDYFALPPGYLDAQLLPRVGGVSSLIPQVKWAIDPARPLRGRAFQRRLHAVVLLNDVHAPIWASDVDAALEIYQALDRFGDLSDAVVHPWWSNGAAVRRPAALKATAYVRDGKALLVVANPGSTRVQGRIELDRGTLRLPSVRRQLDLERPALSPALLVNDGVTVDVPAGDLRLILVE